LERGSQLYAHQLVGWRIAISPPSGGRGEALSAKKKFFSILEAPSLPVGLVGGQVWGAMALLAPLNPPMTMEFHNKSRKCEYGQSIIRQHLVGKKQ